MSKRNPAQNPAQSPGSSWHARVLTSPATTRPSFIPLANNTSSSALPSSLLEPRPPVVGGWGLTTKMQSALSTPSGTRPQSRLCSRASAFVQLSGLRIQPPSAASLLARPAVRGSTRVAASAAQPLLRVAGRIAVRTLPAWWAAAARSLGSARVSPLVVGVLLVYSVGVTLWVARNNRGETSSSSGGEAAGSEPSSSAAAQPTTTVAATRAAVVVAPPVPAARAAQPKAAQPTNDGRVTCKVCAGSGQVSFEDHPTFEEGTICPCCLVRTLPYDPVIAMELPCMIVHAACCCWLCLLALAA